MPSLLAAALAWTTAGLLLGLRGTIFLLAHGNHLALRFTVAIVLGIVFSQVVFAKVSLKYLRRIHAIDLVRPCLFSFFDFRGYLMMATGHWTENHKGLYCLPMFTL